MQLRLGEHQILYFGDYGNYYGVLEILPIDPIRKKVTQPSKVGGAHPVCYPAR